MKLNELKMSEKGNYIIEGIVEEAKVDSYPNGNSFYQLYVSYPTYKVNGEDVIVEEYESNINITGASRGDNGEYIETEESLENAKNLLNELFDIDLGSYQELADNIGQVIDKRIPLFLAPGTINARLTESESFVVYKKFDIELKDVEGKIVDIVDNDHGFVIVVEYEGEHYSKAFNYKKFNQRKRKWANNADTMENYPIAVLSFLGTTPDKIVIPEGGLDITFNVIQGDFSGKPYFIDSISEKEINRKVNAFNKYKSEHNFKEISRAERYRLANEYIANNLK